MNLKHQMPNPKQYQITKIQMAQTVLNLSRQCRDEIGIQDLVLEI
jgi:hypothetical protein